MAGEGFAVHATARAEVVQDFGVQLLSRFWGNLTARSQQGQQAEQDGCEVSGERSVHGGTGEDEDAPAMLASGQRASTPGAAKPSGPVLRVSVTLFPNGDLHQKRAAIRRPLNVGYVHAALALALKPLLDGVADNRLAVG